MQLDQTTIAALASLRTIDLTTVGRQTGRRSRIEIWWFHVDGRFIVTGTPGPRDWYANVLSTPEIEVHAGGTSLPGTARPVHDRTFRRRVFTDPEISWYSTQAELDELVDTAPMIEIEFG